jgi:hypothetical protein
MKNVFSLLFGSPDAAVKTAGAIAKGIDAMVFTDEEKAEHKAKAMEWLGKYMESTQGQNLARRMIAMVVTIQWAVLLNIAVLLQLLEADTKSQYVFKVMDECVNEAFMLVMIFYFGARMLADFGKAKPKE